MGGVVFPRIGEVTYLLTLPGHGFYWFQLPAAREERAGLHLVGDAQVPPPKRLIIGAVVNGPAGTGSRRKLMAGRLHVSDRPSGREPTRIGGTRLAGARIGDAAPRQGTETDLVLTARVLEVSVTVHLSPRPGSARPPQTLFAGRDGLHGPLLVCVGVVLVLPVGILLAHDVGDGFVAPLVAPIQVHDHAPTQDDDGDSRGDDERDQGNMRKPQMRETAQVSQTDACKVAATASGHADCAERQAEAPAPRCSRPAITPIVLHR